MKRFSIYTLGCKVNQYESQQIREFLERLGLSEVDFFAGRADIAVVNTCCVTATASSKSRQYVRKVLAGNGTKVVVCGCLPLGPAGEMKGLGEQVVVVRQRQKLAQVLQELVRDGNGDGESGCGGCKRASVVFGGIGRFSGHTRAFLKVQDGCDGYCSYCIIPRTRPVLQSKPADEVLAEAKRLADAGHREIVVTGVFLGAYGEKTVHRRKWDGRGNGQLAELLERLAQIKGLERIRLSSLECGDVTEELLDVFCEQRKLMPHLHLSLQSGADTVLKRMRRQYSASEFETAAAMVRGRLDRPAVTTDIIVGFPGESEADFEQTMELAERVGFVKMHVFPFSARQGTAAAKMAGRLNGQVIKERARRMRELDKRLGAEFREGFVGKTAEMLVEEDGDVVRGRSERYFVVEIEGADGISKGQIVPVRLKGNHRDCVKGVLA